MNPTPSNFAKSLNQARELTQSIPACNPLNATDLSIVLTQVGQLRGTLREESADVEDCLCGLAERIVELIERNGHISGRQALSLVVDIISEVSEILSAQAGELTQFAEGKAEAGSALPTDAPEQSDPSKLGLKLMDHRKLGEIMVMLSMLTKDQVERALKHQQASGKRFGETLIDLGFINKVSIDSVLRMQRKHQGARPVTPWKDN